MEDVQTLPEMNLEELSVIGFTNYRIFLATYFAQEKKSNPRFSYGEWAKRLNSKDASTLTKIIRGQRHPGPRLIGQLVTYFKFNDSESRYFRSMIQMEKVKEESVLRLQVLESLGKLNVKTRPKKEIDSEAFALISKWYSLAIRQMVKIPNFKLDSNWIADHLQFPVAAGEIQQMLETLISRGFLSVSEESKVAVSAPLDTINDKTDINVRNYHCEMLENAKTSIQKTATEEREFTSLTLAFQSSRIQEAKDLIRKFKADFDELLGEPNAGSDCDSVYQFQMQFFPLTCFEDTNNEPT